MENIFVEFLPPWVETGLQPAFYDKESGTVLQQTARMYARVNMLIRMFNKLSKNTKETVEEYINKFNELHDYVQDYFDNLDVQEEINNKLDVMAEDGTLTDIIAQYLTLAGVLAFSTVADLASAENLTNGSKAKTYGYLREGDGVYDLYTVREILNTDTVDGYNIVALTNTADLVAERKQSGKTVVINLKSTDSINSYLALNIPKKIVLPYNTTYHVTSMVYLNSDTEIDLNSSTLSFDYNNPGETNYFSYRPTDTYTLYNGVKNITFRNGKIVGGCGVYMHSQNVLYENVEFDEINCGHALQIASCYNFVVKNCVFNGTKLINDTANECINIDPCNYGGQPSLDPSSPMYDHNYNSNIIVENNIFNNATDTEHFRYTNAVGSHGRDDDGQLICCGLVIRNNNFGSPYSHTINICDYKDVLIENNNVEYDTDYMLSNDPVRFIYILRGLENIKVIGNTVKNANGLYYTIEPNPIDRKNVLIDSNVFEGDDKENAAIWFRQTFDAVVSNNTLNCVKRALLIDTCRSDESTTIAGTESHDISIYNNIISQSQASAMISLRGNVYNINIENNCFNRNQGYVTNNYVIRSNLMTTISNIFVRFNKNNVMRDFIEDKLISRNVHNNGAIYLLADIGSSKNKSVALNKNINLFKELQVVLGSVSLDSNVLIIRPFLQAREFFSGSEQFRFATSNEDNTLGTTQLTCTDGGTKITYTSNSYGRYIYASI